MEEIRKYAGIINEDDAGSYATALDAFLCKLPKDQPLSHSSVDKFNERRIDKCKNIKDFTFNYDSEEKFVSEVMNWFILKNKPYIKLRPGETESSDTIPAYNRRLIRDKAKEYFKLQSEITHETKADKDAKDRQRKLDYANSYPRY